jgi:hypothetical protein
MEILKTFGYADRMNKCNIGDDDENTIENSLKEIEKTVSEPLSEMSSRFTYLDVSSNG